MGNLKYILILLIFTVLVFGCGRNDNSDINRNETGSSQPTDTVTTATGKKSSLGQAPDFEKASLTGEKIRLSDYKDKIVLLNFWATWCAPCRREIPALIELQDKWKDQGLVIIGVALDEEGFEVVRPYAEDIGINYTIVMDDYSYGDKLGGVYMVPSTYIIDRDGEIVARKIGEITVDAIEPDIKSLLEG